MQKDWTKANILGYRGLEPLLSASKAEVITDYTNTPHYKEIRSI